jgi:glutamate synthase (NADPH/NADH) large chain
MMRKCHLNTCPVGVATQDPELRRRFSGQPEHVVNYMFFVAEELREIMAAMGFRTLNEMIGRRDRIDFRRALSHWKAKGVDLSRLLAIPQAPAGTAIRHVERQDHGLDKALDRGLIEQAMPALNDRKAVKIDGIVRNVNRTVGAMLSGEVAKRYGHAGLADDTIHVKLTGTAGQTFGGWLARGVSLELVGEANDYVGKGLSGGRIAIYPSPKSRLKAEDNIIVGNTVLYGAITGEAYLAGVAGERFAVRNSGALAVVEGVGDHGCEYMTGGVVAVLGRTGRNFAAGMSGGIAYVYDEDGTFEDRLNKAMVKVEDFVDAGQLEASDAELVNMLRYDTARLFRLVQRHLQFTGSKRARWMLDNWAEVAPKFVKVMPTDYRRALAELQAQAETRKPPVKARA